MFPKTDFAIISGFAPKSVSEPELLVVARMIAVGILDVTDKRSPYQANFFLIKKAVKKVRLIANNYLLREFIYAIRS